MRPPIYLLGLIPLVAACTNDWFLPADFRTMELTYAESGNADDLFSGTLTVDLETRKVTGSAAEANGTLSCSGTGALTAEEADEFKALAHTVTVEDDGVFLIEDRPEHTLRVDDDTFEVMPGLPGSYFLYKQRCALMERLSELFPAEDRTLCPVSLERMFNCQE